LVELELSGYTDTGFWGTGSNQGAIGIRQREDNGDYIIAPGGVINGISVGSIGKFTEAGVHIPLSPPFAGTAVFILAIDENNDYMYIGNSQQPSGLWKLDYTTAAVDTTFASNIGSVLTKPTYTAITSRKIDFDSNDKIYWAAPFTFVNGVSYNRIIRLNQDGTSNTTT
jgi:hypothetical protein